MTEPAITDTYGFPRQLAGQLSRVRINQALDSIDAQLEYQNARTFAVEQAMPHITAFGPIVATAGQTIVPLPFNVGVDDVLHVERSGLLHTEGTDYLVVGTNSLTFIQPCEAGEVVQGIWFRLSTVATVPPPSSNDDLFEETPAGVITSTDGYNGNSTFTLSHGILAGSTPKVTISGFLILEPLDDYTWTSNQIVFTAGNNPVIGETITVGYKLAP